MSTQAAHHAASTAQGADAARDLRAAFAHVREWVFDLDNTLYCASARLFDQIDARMREYLMRLFRVDAATARFIQKDYFHRYGTTLRGLIVNGEIGDPDDFLSFVHDIDYSAIAPDTALDEALAALEGRKWVFTNGSLAHAERVLERLGVLAHIDEIFDVKAAGYVPKPHRQAFDAFFTRTGIAPRHSAMFEDIARNLAEPHARGMTTVLVTHPANTDSAALNHHGEKACGCGAHGHAASESRHPHDDIFGPHVHFRTRRLSDFLSAIAGGENAIRENTTTLEGNQA